MQYQYLIYRALFFSMFFALTACNEPIENSTYNPELLFTAGHEIIIDNYEYTDPLDSNIYFVNNDSITDTLGSMPEFCWLDETGKLVTVAISKEELLVENGTIVNAGEIIWQWHTGMGSQSFIGSIGNKYLKVSFLEGRNVENKNILYQTQPIALESGLYFWAVWGWDRGGKRVIFSSRQRGFVVK
ncbi:MAG: hypothetical protein JXB34_01690 [Bacteroidales bacterium]|nr:hypothetical protein [Bacteroidales bacterium]